MHFGSPDGSIRHSNGGAAFQLPPAARPELLAQLLNIANAAADGNSLNVCYPADNLLCHVVVAARNCLTVLLRRRQAERAEPFLQFSDAAGLLRRNHDGAASGVYD